MTITDILTIIGIVVSIVFGFFFTHYYSIRDTRTRVLKDYYIEEVKAVKVRVDKFFHEVAFGKSSFKKVVNWYDHLNIDVVSIDHGVRKSLYIKTGDLIGVVDSYYGEITNWDDFNDQFSNPNYRPSNEHVIRLKQIKYEIDEFLNEYISHINESNSYPIWKIFCRNEEKKFPYFRPVFNRLAKPFSWGCILLFIIIVCITKIEIKENDDIVAPLNSISNKQDSIYREIQMLREKYEPIEIQSKTFNNSSFFSAERIDSVLIRLYQEKGDMK